MTCSQNVGSLLVLAPATLIFEPDDCPQRPEMTWDGHSIGLDFTAVPAAILGPLP